MAIQINVDGTRAPGPFAALRAALLCVTRVALAGLTFRAAHRWLPTKLVLAGTPFAMATLAFGLAHLARRVQDGSSPLSALAEAGLLFAVLLLVSIANRMAELFVVLCIVAGIDGMAAALTPLGLRGPEQAWLSTLLLAWLASAIPVALVRMGLARLPRPDAEH